MDCNKTNMKYFNAGRHFKCLQGAAIKSKHYDRSLFEAPYDILERITSWLFWCVGALYTAHIIATSITRFFKYPSIITARNGISGWYQRFGNIWVYNVYMYTIHVNFNLISIKKLHFQSFSYAHIQCIQNTNWEIITLILTVKHFFWDNLIKILDTTLKKFYGQARSKRTKEFWNKLVISNLVSTRFHLNSLSRGFWIHERSS